jgi:outer membrane protein assembly factor BamB
MGLFMKKSALFLLLLSAAACASAQAAIRSPEIAWRKPFPTPALWMGLIGEKLFIRSDKSVLCINPKDGSLLWKKESAAEVEFIERCSAAAFLRDGNGTLTKLRMSDGSAEWFIQSFPNARIFSCTDDYAFGHSDRGIARLNLKTGNREWVQRVDGLNGRPVRYSGGILLADKIVWRVFDANSGRPLKTVERPAPQYFLTPSEDGKILLAVYSQKISAVNPSDLSPLWEKGFNSPVSATPKANRDMAVVPESPGSIEAFTLTNGNKIWTYFAGEGLRFSPELTDDAVYFAGDNGSLFALDLNGKPLWKRLHGPMVAAPVYFDDLLFVLGKDGVVTAYKDSKKPSRP